MEPSTGATRGERAPKRSCHRFRSPAVTWAGGTAIAAAATFANGWSAGALVETVTVVAAAGYYVLGGRDTDLGAIFGSRPDERQASAAMRASALAATAMAVVTLFGYAVAVALHAETWPFDLVAGAGAAAFVTGLVAHRSGGGAVTGEARSA